MNRTFYSVPVKEVRLETANAVSVLLDIPVDLQREFRFKAGQYITFKHFHNGEEIRRSYSLCSSPFENEWRVAIKKVPGGVFSTFANEALKAGDLVELMPPHGNFIHEVKSNSGAKYIFFAAGSGITPIISLIKDVLHHEESCEVILFYGNKSRKEIIFKEEMDALKNKYMGRFSLHYLLSRERMDAKLFHGRLDEEKCTMLINCFPDVIDADKYFLCGPFEMIKSISKTLETQGVQSSKIYFELFTTPGQPKEYTARKVDSSELKGPFSKVTIRLDGIAFDFDLPYHGDNILDAAMNTGADVPYACKGGVCSTCKAKLLEGTVDMELNYALEPDEIEKGYILTCQSHPTSKRTVVDFDQ
jgi:ring-1,2-phenylacetyl-CoA epoxidase subunit PaaE